MTKGPASISIKTEKKDEMDPRHDREINLEGKNHRLHFEVLIDLEHSI
jgi:hypothetical protein